MEQTLVQEITQTNELRANFARMLASLYLYELKDDQIESFAHLSFIDDGTLIARGYATIVEYLRHRNRATAQILAVDYAHTFLSAGSYEKLMVPPYESVFTSKSHLLMQDARDGALKYYRSEELDLPVENTTPEDHLGFELQFVAEMIDRSTQALNAGDHERFVALIEKQRSFFTYHQENWLPIFCQAIDENCMTDFYHGVADLTRGYLEMERDILDCLADECGIGEAIELKPDWKNDGIESNEMGFLELMSTPPFEAAVTKASPTQVVTTRAE